VDNYKKQTAVNLAKIVVRTNFQAKDAIKKAMLISNFSPIFALQIFIINIYANYSNN
jgi:hypothetical protein